MSKYNKSLDWKFISDDIDCVKYGIYNTISGKNMYMKFKTTFISKSGNKWTRLPLSNCVGYSALNTISTYITFISVIGVNIDQAYDNVKRFIHQYTYIIDDNVLDVDDETQNNLLKTISEIYNKPLNRRVKILLESNLIDIEYI